jgi:hypothetical protein
MRASERERGKVFADVNEVYARKGETERGGGCRCE